MDVCNLKKAGMASKGATGHKYLRQTFKLTVKKVKRVAVVVDGKDVAKEYTSISLILHNQNISSAQPSNQIILPIGYWAVLDHLVVNHYNNFVTYH